MYDSSLSDIANDVGHPLEIFRECISNSYDAGATDIRIYTMPAKRALVFGDDGSGLSTVEDLIIPRNNQSISSWDSFFYIGASTKEKGQGVGHMCRGSKLLLANSSTYCLVSRNKGMEDNKWLCKVLKDFGTTAVPDVSPEELNTEEMKQKLREQIFNSSSDPSAKSYRDEIFSQLDAISEKGKSGTWIFALGCELLKEFLALPCYSIPSCWAKKPGTTTQEVQRTALWTYIRTRTRHGSIFIPDKDGHAAGFKSHKLHDQLFPARRTGQQNEQSTLERAQHYRNRVRAARVTLYWHESKQLMHSEIPFGFPILPYDQEHHNTDAILTMSRTANFTGQARFSGVVQDSLGKDYEVIFLIDGKLRAMQKYDFFDRQGAKGNRTGIKYADFHGIVFAVEGIPIEFYSKDKILEGSEFSVLTTEKMAAQSHFTLFINGDFTVTPDRNGIAPLSKSHLEEDGEFKRLLVKLLRSFRDTKSNHGSLFSNFLRRIKKDVPMKSSMTEAELQLERKQELVAADRFVLINLPSPGAGDFLNGKVFICPDAGHERQVEVIYSQLALFAPKLSIRCSAEFADLWIRPLQFYHTGIDAIALENERSLTIDTLSNQATATRLTSKFIEFKVFLNNTEQFNHPFEHCDYIVCWDLSDGVFAKLANEDLKLEISDEAGSVGTLMGFKDPKTKLMSTVKCKITNILVANEDGETIEKERELNRDIIVICLKRLIEATFGVGNDSRPIPPYVTFYSQPGKLVSPSKSTPKKNSRAPSKPPSATKKAKK